MTTYEDPERMLEDIREHVFKGGPGHEVLPADNPMNQMIGYMCPICEVFWHVGLVHVKSLTSSSIGALVLRGSTSGTIARLSLTDYLNYRGRHAPVPKTEVVSRYRRPWLI